MSAWSERVLGTGVAHTLRVRATAPVLQIGADRFSRHDLAGIDCYSFTAAANLSAILNRELKVKDTKDLFHTVPPEALVLPRLGAISVSVLGAAFEAKGLGGDAPLDTWVRMHWKLQSDDKLVTFVSLKHRDAKERAQERHEAKKRARAERHTTHRERLQQFEATLRPGAGLS